MPEKHINYRELTREKKLEVLESLAALAVTVVQRLPDILDRTLLQYMEVRHEYGYVALLGLQRAIKNGHVIPRDDGYNILLNIRNEDE